MAGGVSTGSIATFSSVSTDTRKLQSGQVFFALRGPNFDGEAFAAEAFSKGAVAVVASSRLSGGPCVIVDNAQAALQRFAHCHRMRHHPLVFGLTGSCGKTTSKDLVSAVLGTRLTVVKTQGNLNNEVGCPLSLLQIDAATDAAIIEMGAANTGNIAELCALSRPTESAVTLVAPVHLAGFGSIENIARTKGEIAEALPPDGVFYVNTGDPWCVQIAERFSGEKIGFGPGGAVNATSWEYTDAGALRLTVDPIGELELMLPSPSHISNVLLAVAVGLRHGVTEFQEALEKATSDPARFKRLDIGGIEVIDDTYNASPLSVAAALDGLAARPGGGQRLAALGDMLELGPDAEAMHRQIGEKAGRSGVMCLFAYGPFAYATIEGARVAGCPHAQTFDTHEALADALHDVLKPGDRLLVKGSRGMRMERVIEALRARISRT